MDEITKGKIKSIRTTKHTLFSDPGHAWLCVMESHLDLLNIRDKISNCSYVHNGFVYLEEDADIPIYIGALFPEGTDSDAFETFKQQCVTFNTTNDESFIRDYKRFNN